MKSSWGNFPKVTQREHALAWRSDHLPADRPLLPYGMGRSYGDVAMNDGGTIITTSRLDHLISFDPRDGLLRCESGISIAELLQITVPYGWFMPVVPGTKFVSVGGAIANDVHGKNHHRAGTFGCHVRQLELLRSDGRHICSPKQNSDLFRATIGGLGLTGIITWAEIQLVKIPSVYLATETVRTHDLAESLAISQSSEGTHEYTVAWIDTASKAAGRGLFGKGNFIEASEPYADAYRRPLATLPFFMPDWFITTPLIKAFNLGYYRKQFAHQVATTVHYDPFFFPLDVLQYWNKLYGKRGFQSYQCVVPNDKGEGEETIERLLRAIRASGLASPLTVLKIFGDTLSPSMLSFPRPGINLLLDFPNVGKKLTDLLIALDEITLQAGGCVNPSKDAHVSALAFQQMYPNWHTFEQYIDPAFSSSFWRRVTKKL